VIGTDSHGKIATGLNRDFFGGIGAQHQPAANAATKAAQRQQYWKDLAHLAS
jgi:hypothetical protein